MAAQLNSTVYVPDPDTRQTVELAAGTSPEPRLAALVTNPAAWVDGKLPRLPKAAEQKTEGGQSGAGDGQDGASGDASDAPGDADQPSQEAAPAAKKTAARKTAAASKPARGRDAAEQGDSGE